MLNNLEHDNCKCYYMTNCYISCHFIWLKKIQRGYVMANNRQQDLIRQLEKLISANLANNVSLKMLAELTHYNPTYLSRLYRQKTGHTLSALIKRKKIERALYLLEKTQLNTSAIAAGTGYKSAECFSRFFKKYTGMTPYEYKFYYGLRLKARKKGQATSGPFPGKSG